MWENRLLELLGSCRQKKKKKNQRRPQSAFSPQMTLTPEPGGHEYVSVSYEGYHLFMWTLPEWWHNPSVQTEHGTVRIKFLKSSETLSWVQSVISNCVLPTGVVKVKGPNYFISIPVWSGGRGSCAELGHTTPARWNHPYHRQQAAASERGREPTRDSTACI